MESINDIVEQNFTLMRSAEIGGMSNMLGSESIGGNAGAMRACANFLYNHETGKIKEFTNHGFLNTDSHIKEGYFIIEYTQSRKGLLPDTYEEKACTGIIIKEKSNFGKNKILEQTIDRYNCWKESK